MVAVRELVESVVRGGDGQVLMQMWMYPWELLCSVGVQKCRGTVRGANTV